MVLGGLLYALAFPPLSLSALAWVALVPFGWALERAYGSSPQRTLGQGFRLGYLFGLVLFLLSLHWIALLRPIAVTVPWIMYPAWPAAAAYLSLFPAAVGAVVLVLRKRRGWPVWCTLPVVWIAVEKLRGLGELGFPWMWLGYSQWNAVAPLQWAALGGPLLVGLWIAVGNGLWLRLVTLPAAAGGRRRLAATVTALLWMALVGAGGAWIESRVRGDEGSATRVALVQGNVAGEIKWDPSRNAEVLALFLAETRQALALEPQLVVWPETATGSYLRRDPVARHAVESFVDSTGVPILTGFPDVRWAAPDRPAVTNSAGTFLPGRGIREVYDKVHLVPFGERLPFQWLLPWLGEIDLGQAEFQPGAGVVLLPGADRRVGVLICFESIFPDDTRAARRDGATLLAVLTNDEWFGDSAALSQHASMSVFRAVETRLPLVRCANTGLSFFVDPRGRLHERTGAFTREVRVHAVEGPGEPPPFVRVGDLAGTLCLIVMTLALWVPRRGSF